MLIGTGHLQAGPLPTLWGDNVLIMLFTACKTSIHDTGHGSNVVKKSLVSFFKAVWIKKKTHTEQMLFGI